MQYAGQHRVNSRVKFMATLFWLFSRLPDAMEARRDRPPAGPMLSVRFREARRVGVSAWAPSAGLSWLSTCAAAPTFTLSAFLLAPRLILEAVCHLLAASALLAGEEAGAGSVRSLSLSPGLAASPPSSLSSSFTSAERLARHGKREALGKAARNQTCTSADRIVVAVVRHRGRAALYRGCAAGQVALWRSWLQDG